MTKKVRLTLMNKNIPVIDFDYDIELNVICELYHNYPNNEKSAPINVFDLKIGISKVLLMNWFRNRIMSETKDGIDEYLKEYDYNYDKFMIDLIIKRHGFNLSNQYWFRLDTEDMNWEDGNYFNNNFDDGVGRKIINDNIYSSPNTFTNGNLFKKWIIDGNERFLLKGGTHMIQEPYNEVIATKLYERILLPQEFVKYDLDRENNKIFRYESYI